jgi:hypothetical protein
MKSFLKKRAMTTKFIFQQPEIFDFQFELRKAIDSQRFLGNNDYSISDKKDNEQSLLCPIGSVEYVHNYMLKHNIPVPKPINVPDELFPTTFSGRSIINIDIEKYEKNNDYGNLVKFNNRVEDETGKEIFVKSSDTVKDESNGFTRILLAEKDKSYQVSEEVDIVSEWRGFVFNKQLVDCRCYSGNFRMFPDFEKVDKMICTYQSSPIAYTLDLYVNYVDTFCLEVHNFYSCGLYGFRNYNILCQMFSGWWKEYLRRNNDQIYERRRTEICTPQKGESSNSSYL